MTQSTPRIARRMAGIAQFHVMALLARARELEAQGRSIVHMEIGEPDFPTPQPVVDAGMRAIEHGDVHYMPALGLPELRAAIARYYATRYGLDLDPARVVVTSGSSGALLLALAVVVDAGERVLLADPGYPANRNFVRLLGAEPAGIPVEAATRYQLSADAIARNWDARTAGALLASPSNPTGMLVSFEAMGGIAECVRERGGALIVDEIYHGLTYGAAVRSALELGDDIFVVNSFSKYFNMTGWRLGWLIAPPGCVGELDKLSQNVYLSAPTPSQRAALAAFEPATLAILERRRTEFRARRDFLVPALRAIGFGIEAPPEGAFYVYADSSRLAADSYQLSMRLLEEAGVAITPGIDFGEHRAGAHVRFAYTTSLANLQEGVSRIRRFVGAG
ncbi:MAG TPA: pyridoxal phosphate-dependent aminotransferase [Burkholderiales bacterium]|nr:pyridoxal phosphate-dependent aminotransferase [Burkholderiales bacterium]